MSSIQHIARTGRFLATVTGRSELSSRMRRLTLAAPEIAGIIWPLGCDIAVVLSCEGREIRRRYTVRAVENGHLTVDVLLHGNGPGSAWAQRLQAGDEVTLIGPRGEVGVPSCEWLLAVTDESGLPAVAAVAESLGRPVRVLAEIADQTEQYPLPANATVHWIIRGDRPAGSADGFLAALRPMPAADGSGHALVLGESRSVVTIRDALARLGLGRDQIYAKGYWNLNARPTR